MNNILQNLYEREQNRSTMLIDLKETFSENSVYERKGSYLNILDENGDIKYSLTKHAFTQMCRIVGARGKTTMTPKYLWENPATIQQNMAYHLGEMTEHYETLLNIHNGFIINGLLSSNYVGVSNYDVLRLFWEQCQIQHMVPASIDIKTYDDFYDTMRCVILFKEFINDNNLYGAGVLILNSQNGQLGLTVQPIVKSTACDNSITMYTERWYRRHTGDINEEVHEAFNNLREYVDISVELYYAYHDMRQIIVPDMDAEIDKIMSMFKIPKKYREVFLEGLTSEYDKQEYTVFGLVSGLTYLAQRMKDIVLEQRLIEYASKIIMDNMEAVKRKEATIE